MKFEEAKKRYIECYKKYRRYEIRLTNQIKDGDHRFETYSERREARKAIRMLKRLMKNKILYMNEFNIMYNR